MSEILLFQAILFLCGTTALVASLRVVRRWLELKHERRIPDAIDAIADRLARIEQTTESTAVEVERLAEANRFMARLLAERAALPLPGTRPERVITPH